uniref:Aminotransferase-like plant mobile domain-containing protein n=2 Tax=Lotus japonicus TaxID=34305 RepID=I3T1Z7_LOTJA|nr:unknown [Lotus japonicus]
MERFPALQRYPQTVEEQVLRRWAKCDGVKMVKDKNLKSVLDSAGDCNRFLWRPYNNSPSLKLYNEKEMWECDNPNLDYELESFDRCLRACKLVGMGCVEQYLPHRVALQFGLDQDIPGMVLDCNNDPWKSEGSFGPPPGFTSKFGRDQAGDFDKKDQLGERRDNDDSKEAKMKSPLCDINGAIDMEGEGEGARVGLGAKVVSELKATKLRISKLEKVIAELKAAKFGPKVESGAPKAKP